MRIPRTTTALLALFTALTFMSVIAVYVLQQIPTEVTTRNTLCTYASAVTYDYTAILEPNTIYNNKPSLKPNEGTLYTKITRQINMTLTYTFQATLPADVTVTYSLTQTLKTPAWAYKTAEIPPTTTNQTQIQITLQPISKTEIDSTRAEIDSETGTSTTTYFLEIMPTFTVIADTTAGSIEQTFTPTLTINFKRTEQGDIITTENLQQTKSDALTENQTTLRVDIINQRYISYILIAVSTAGLGLSTYFYTKNRMKTEEIPFDKLISPYRDLIIEAQESPTIQPETTVVNVESMKDLAKTAEILAKPIILTRKPKPMLTIIDQDTLYQHKPAKPNNISFSSKTTIQKPAK